MECGYCGKKLIESKKFINENDFVECSGCRNTFKFIPDNLRNKSSIEPADAKNKLIIRFAVRLSSAFLLIALYFIFSSGDTTQTAIFTLINLLPLIIITGMQLSKVGALPDYGSLVNDRALFTYPFWLVFYEFSLAIFLNLIFFIIY